MCFFPGALFLRGAFLRFNIVLSEKKEKRKDNQFQKYNKNTKSLISEKLVGNVKMGYQQIITECLGKKAREIIPFVVQFNFVCLQFFRKNK